MPTAELIAELQKLPQEALVFVYAEGHSYYAPAQRVSLNIDPEDGDTWVSVSHEK